MRRLIVRALASAALVSLVLAAPALASHSWSNYHWAQASTSAPNVRVPLVNDLTPSSIGTDWPALFHGGAGAPGGGLGSVVHDWSNADLYGSTWSDLLETPWATGSGTPCDAVADQVVVCNGSYGETGWLGIAQISVFKSHIRYGFAKVNDTYLDDPARGYDNDVARQHVLCQEVGHTFGLGHQDESGADLDTCMDYARPHDNAHPNAHDNEQLNAIYSSHTDGSKGGGGPGRGNGKSSVRRLGKNVYVEHFENGVKVFTHVTWVDDGAAHRAPNDRVPQ